MLVVGATLAGAVPWRERSGDGHRAVQRPPRRGADRRSPRARPEGGGDERPRRPRTSSCATRSTTASSARSARRSARSPTSRRCSAGPKYAGPQAERFRVADEPSVDASVDYCSGCGICTQVCPQGVKIAEINAQARAKLKRQKGVPLRDRLITRPTWLGRAGTPAAPIANWTIDKRAAADRSARSCSRSTATRRRPTSPGGASALGAQAREPADRAQGRLLPRLRHQVLRAARRARRSSRCSSTTASRSRSRKQDCCGLPLQSNGLFDDARKVRAAPGAQRWRRTCATTTRHRRQRRRAAR